MNKLIAIVVSCLVLAGLLAGETYGAAADQRPNIVFIASEDISPDLGC